MLRVITVLNISSVDLNLLVVLHAVLEERNATRAARRLGVTQSAVSNALVRLRELLHDPLMIRHARGLTPTLRAEAIAPRLASLLRELGALIDDTPAFAPRTTSREFTLACADYYGVVVAPTLAALLRERAPNASLRLVTLEQLVQGGGLAREVDVHVGRPPVLPADCRFEAIFEEHFVCLTRRQGRARKKMSLREYREAEHVRVQVLDTRVDPIDRGLASRGVTRKIALTVPNFAIVPWVVLQTGYVATLSSRFAEQYARQLPLDVRTPPLPMRAQPVKMVWHQRTHDDPAAKFFRALVIEASR